MSARKKVLENSFLYTVSSLLVKAMGFLLLPIYTTFLTPTDYGITGLVTGFVNVSNFIVAFSLYSAIIRLYSDYKDDHNKLKRFNGTVVIFVFLSGLVFLSIGIIFNGLFTKYIFEGISFFPIVLVAFVNLIFITLNRVHLNMLQAMQKGRKLTAINVIVFIAIAVFNLIFIVGFHMGALGMVLSQTVVFSMYSIYMLSDLKKNNLITFCIDKHILIDSVKYSIPLMPHNLSTHIAGLISRVFINTSSTLAYVGLYNIGMQFAALIDVIQVAVNKAFQPWLFQELKRNDDKSRQEALTLSNLLLTGYSVVYMGIGLFSQEVVVLMTSSDYILSWTVIPILVMGYSVKSIYYFYVNLIMYHREAARKLFIATTIGSLVNIVLAYYLVDIFGMYGAATAFMIAKIIIVMIVVYISRNYNIIGYKVIKMIKIILPSILFMWIGLYFSYTKYIDVFNLSNMIYKIIIMLIYLVMIFYLNRKAIKEYGIIDKVLKKISRKNEV